MNRWNGRQITREQREEILQAYLRDKAEGCALATRLGLAEDYAYKLARERGLLPVTRYRPRGAAPTKKAPWTEENMQRLRDLALTMRYAHLIAVAMDTTQHSIVVIAGRENIDVIKQSPEQSADSEAKLRAREQRKQAKWKAKQIPAASCASICVKPGTSKTSVIYRNQLPRIDDCMSKDRLRAMIAEACRNTAEMQTNAA